MPKVTESYINDIYNQTCIHDINVIHKFTGDEFICNNGKVSEIKWKERYE